MRSAKEAVAYVKKIHSLVRYIENCDGNMQEGSFRCDANVSVRPLGQEELGTRAELKSINSFRNVERGINIEVERQIELIEDEKINQSPFLPYASPLSSHGIHILFIFNCVNLHYQRMRKTIKLRFQLIKL